MNLPPQPVEAEIAGNRVGAPSSTMMRPVSRSQTSPIRRCRPARPLSTMIRRRWHAASALPAIRCTFRRVLRHARRSRRRQSAAGRRASNPASSHASRWLGKPIQTASWCAHSAGMGKGMAVRYLAARLLSRMARNSSPSFQFGHASVIASIRPTR